MRGRTGRALAVLGAVVAWGAVVPSNAQAATGQFVYHTQPGNVARTLTDPRDGDCYPLSRQGDGTVTNGTDRRAVLYEDKNCRNVTVEELDPGQWSVHSVFRSVLFTP
ncbi:hypothetical protein JNUCC64_30390 [Streptomyces sp. JNUCC 64]